MQSGHRLLSVLIGGLAGSLSGLMGVGGGLIMVPGMVLAMGFPQHLANGTSLAAIFFTALAALYAYSRAGFVDWPLAGFLAIGSVVGAIFGSLWSHKVKSSTLQKMFGVFLIGVAIWMFIQQPSPHSPVRQHSFADLGFASHFLVLGLGVVTGIIAGFFGVGGGLIMVPMMTLILSLAQREAQGVSLAVIIPTAFSGWMIHRRKGSVNPKVAFYLATASMVFAWLVARIAVRTDDTILRQIFSGFLLLTAVNLLAKRDSKIK